VLSQVVLPAQKIANGVVKLQAIEGFVAEVQFEGDSFADHAGLLAAFAEKIKASKPLRLADLERYVLLADDLAGLEAKTVIKPAPNTPGGAVLTFLLTRKPISAAFTADNRGTRAIGPYQLDGSVEVSDQTGFFESTRLRVIGTPEFQELIYIDLAETIPLNSEGTTLSLGARRSWSEPGADVAQFNLNSRSLTLRAAISHPIIRSRSETLRASVALTAREYDTQALGQPLAQDHLRVVSAGLTYDVADALGGTNLIGATLHRGLPILGASEKSDTNLSRGGASGDFYKITASAQRHQPLFDAVSLFTALEGQYSPHKLLSSEEYGLGGAYFGSAFDYSELTGDSAIAGRAELQYSPDLGFPEIRLSQVYVFTDGGAVWNYEEDTRYGWQTLWSAGVGVRVAVTDNVIASVEAAKPISPAPTATGDKDWRGFFSVTLRY
jgi:hemolysin activation/secretion protein